MTTKANKDLATLKEILLKQFKRSEIEAECWLYIPNRIYGNLRAIDLINRNQTKLAITLLQDAVRKHKFE